MLLLKPWRGYDEINFVKKVLRHGAYRMTESETWERMYVTYETWRKKLEAGFQHVRSGSVDKPAFNTEEWWAAVTYPSRSCTSALKLLLRC